MFSASDLKNWDDHLLRAYHFDDCKKTELSLIGIQLNQVTKHSVRTIQFMSRVTLKAIESIID